MINKLVEKIKKTNAPIVVGLDPMLSYVPEHIQKAAFAQFGETLEGRKRTRRCPRRSSRGRRCPQSTAAQHPGPEAPLCTDWPSAS